MPDLAKVIKGIECSIGTRGVNNCLDCPYDAEEQCSALLLRDALELLNDTTEWDPVDPDRRGYSNVFECNECGGRVYYTYWVEECDYNFCPWCGRRTR